MRSSGGREGRGSRIGTCLGKEELDSVRRVEDVSNEDLTRNAGSSSTRRWRDATDEHVPEADRSCVSIRIGEARVEWIVDVAGILQKATSRRWSEGACTTGVGKSLLADEALFSSADRTLVACFLGS